MKKYISALLSFAFLTGCAAPSTEFSYQNISVNEAISLMEKESNFILLDVRTPQEYKEGHIPGAINIPNETIKDTEPTSLPDKDQLILVYCRSGNRSKQASQKLANMGYTNIQEFGGIQDWPGDVTTSNS